MSVYMCVMSYNMLCGCKTTSYEIYPQRTHANKKWDELNRLTKQYYYLSNSIISHSSMAGTCTYTLPTTQQSASLSGDFVAIYKKEKSAN